MISISSMKNRRSNLLAAAALWLVLLASGSARADGGPRDVVKKITDEVIAVLQQKSKSADRKRAEIQTIVYGYVDFETMSRLVLAKHWSGLSDQQKSDFASEFKNNLALTYGQNVESYRDEKVTITGDRQEARSDWTVKTKILRNGPNDILVDYRLRQKDGTWRIIDVIIERVSLVSNFRSQFQDIMSNGGIERLLKLLQEKNRSGQSLKAPGPPAPKP